jgi:hypothetical protein
MYKLAPRPQEIAKNHQSHDKESSIKSITPQDSQKQSPQKYIHPGNA